MRVDDVLKGHGVGAFSKLKIGDIIPFGKITLDDFFKTTNSENLLTSLNGDVTIIPEYNMSIVTKSPSYIYMVDNTELTIIKSVYVNSDMYSTVYDNNSKKIYVCLRGKINVYDLDLVLLDTINFPTEYATRYFLSMVIDELGEYLYVGSYGRVLKYNLLTNELVLDLTLATVTNYPNQIILKNGYLYVCDGRVDKYSVDGVYQWSKPLANHLYVDEDDNLYISYAASISKFNSAGDELFNTTIFSLGGILGFDFSKKNDCFFMIYKTPTSPYTAIPLLYDKDGVELYRHNDYRRVIDLTAHQNIHIDDKHNFMLFNSSNGYLFKINTVYQVYR